MKSLAKKAVLGSRVLRLAARLRPSGTAILMYHSVRADPAEAADFLGGIVHSEAVFRGQMELLEREFHPITLAALAEHLRLGRELPRRSVVVTFDDGYADNHEIAMPILNRTGVPAVFYLTVDCIENSRLPWPARLRFSFRRTHKHSWRDPAGKEWTLQRNGNDNGNDDQARETAFTRACEACCRLTGAAQDDFVAGVERQLETAAASQASAPAVSTTSMMGMMSYEHIRDLTQHGHLVGSHTLSHPNMAYVSQDQAIAELSESKKRLERQLGAPIAHFAYPCPALSPHWNEFTVGASAKAGYETAVTTNWGLVRAGDDPLWLKRVLPTKTVEGLRWNLECAFAVRPGWRS
jgi:peptidoglycan/xylan/chitin deacetylase (PgdA/CDA1 family)